MTAISNGDASPSTGYTLIIDNYDSFTWNVYADVAVLKGNPLVRRNDKITIENVEVSYSIDSECPVCH